MKDIDVVPSFATLTINPKVHIECPKCGDIAIVDTSVVLTSIPAQYEWYCPHCGEHSYISCDEVKSIDPAIFKKTGARFATHCEICGDEILVYGNENPTICKNCKEAIIAMRKTLGTWHD